MSPTDQLSEPQYGELRSGALDTLSGGLSIISCGDPSGNSKRDSLSAPGCSCCCCCCTCTCHCHCTCGDSSYTLNCGTAAGGGGSSAAAGMDCSGGATWCTCSRRHRARRNGILTIRRRRNGILCIRRRRNGVLAADGSCEGSWDGAAAAVAEVGTAVRSDVGAKQRPLSSFGCPVKGSLDGGGGGPGCCCCACGYIGGLLSDGDEAEDSIAGGGGSVSPSGSPYDVAIGPYLLSPSGGGPTATAGAGEGEAPSTVAVDRCGTSNNSSCSLSLSAPPPPPTLHEQQQQRVQEEEPEQEAPSSEGGCWTVVFSPAPAPLPPFAAARLDAAVVATSAVVVNLASREDIHMYDMYSGRGSYLSSPVIQPHPPCGPSTSGRSLSQMQPQQRQLQPSSPQPLTASQHGRQQEDCHQEQLQQLGKSTPQFRQVDHLGSTAAIALSDLGFERQWEGAQLSSTGEQDGGDASNSTGTKVPLPLLQLPQEQEQKKEQDNDDDFRPSAQVEVRQPSSAAAALIAPRSAGGSGGGGSSANSSIITTNTSSRFGGALRVAAGWGQGPPLEKPQPPQPLQQPTAPAAAAVTPKAANAAPGIGLKSHLEEPHRTQSASGAAASGPVAPGAAAASPPLSTPGYHRKIMPSGGQCDHLRFPDSDSAHPANGGGGAGAGAMSHRSSIIAAAVSGCAAATAAAVAVVPGKTPYRVPPRRARSLATLAPSDRAQSHAHSARQLLLSGHGRLVTPGSLLPLLHSPFHAATLEWPADALPGGPLSPKVPSRRSISTLTAVGYRVPSDPPSLGQAAALAGVGAGRLHSLLPSGLSGVFGVAVGPPARGWGGGGALPTRRSSLRPPATSALSDVEDVPEGDDDEESRMPPQPSSQLRRPSGGANTVAAGAATMHQSPHDEQQQPRQQPLSLHQQHHRQQQQQQPAVVATASSVPSLPLRCSGHVLSGPDPVHSSGFRNSVSGMMSVASPATAAGAASTPSDAPLPPPSVLAGGTGAMPIATGLPLAPCGIAPFRRPLADDSALVAAAVAPPQPHATVALRPSMQAVTSRDCGAGNLSDSGSGGLHGWPVRRVQDAAGGRTSTCLMQPTALSPATASGGAPHNTHPTPPMLTPTPQVPQHQHQRVVAPSPPSPRSSVTAASVIRLGRWVQPGRQMMRSSGSGEVAGPPSLLLTPQAAEAMVQADVDADSGCSVLSPALSAAAAGAGELPLTQRWARAGPPTPSPAAAAAAAVSGGAASPRRELLTTTISLPPIWSNSGSSTSNNNDNSNILSLPSGARG